MITGCTVSNNSADEYGGGFYDCDGTISNCTITGNSASIYGGGICCIFNHSTAIISCTISDNEADWGGGIWCESDLKPIITNCTISSNSAYQGGGGIGTATIELPTVRVQDLQTTCSVPDRGTLLLGGQKVAGETDREMGAPLLNKIPILNRFFSNRGKARDEYTLLILVKPTIIIQSESEEDAFP